MTDGMAPLDYPSAIRGGGLPVFTALRSGKDGPIVELRQSQEGDGQFKVFSGLTDTRTGKIIGAHRENGMIPKGTWFIAKYANAPAVIRRKATSDRVGAMTGQNLINEVRHRSYWMALYRDDRDIGQPIDDETFVQGQRRSLVRAHFGRYSLGCLTFRDTSQYAKFIETLVRRPPDFIDSAGRSVEAGTKGAIEVYGKLVVGDAVKAAKPRAPDWKRIFDWL
ncbi:tlde1 domain-containing protein [Sulfitobacter sp.]|jgi:hypothetical protein|uniref:tlde1 domain-containing protein n=1 Tax=Sulfitobacter sp. TaxID=1903071 RepID=UPI003001C4BE